jgi:hypothetical protein
MKLVDGLNEMASGPNTDSQSPRCNKLIGVALLGLVLALLGGAFLLSMQLRPQVGLEPAASARQGSEATPVPVAEPGPTLGPPVGAIESPTPTPSPVPARADASPTAASADGPVGQAYRRYWEIYAQALYTLDPSRLEEVMGGTELDRVQKQIDELRSHNQAAKLEVRNDYTVVSLGPSEATIVDRYLNRSYTVDAATKRALQSPGEGQVEEITARLELVDGQWKVVEVAQARRP